MGGTDNVYRNSYNVYQSCADGNMNDWIYTYSGDSCRIDTGTVQNISGKNYVVDVSLPVARSVAAEMHTIGRQATETTDSANSQLNENMGGNDNVYRNSYNVYQSCADGNMDDWIYTYNGDSRRCDSRAAAGLAGEYNWVDVNLPVARSVAAEMHTIGRQATETTDSANSQLNENMGGNNSVGCNNSSTGRSCAYDSLDRVCTDSRISVSDARVDGDANWLVSLNASNALISTGFNIKPLLVVDV